MVCHRQTAVGDLGSVNISTKVSGVREHSDKDVWGAETLRQGCLGCGSTPTRMSGVREHSDNLKGFDLRATRVPVSTSLNRGFTFLGLRGLALEVSMVDPRDADCHQSPGHTTKRSVWGWVRSVVALPHKYCGRGRGLSGKNFWSVGTIGQGCLGCGNTPTRLSGVREHSENDVWGARALRQRLRSPNHPVRQQ